MSESKCSCGAPMFFAPGIGPYCSRTGVDADCDKPTLVAGPRRSVLMEAEELVNGPRRAKYGHPRENFARIIALWQAYLDGRPGGRMADLTVEDHAALMILLKLARLQQTPDHRDSLVDGPGYFATWELLADGGS